MVKGKRIIPIEQALMVFPTRIIGVTVRVMIWPKLEVIDICSLVTIGRGKRIPNLTIKVTWFKDPQLSLIWGGDTCI